MPFTLRDYAAAPRVTDGAWGTQLVRRGLTPGLAPESWNLQQPDLVLAVAESYIQAGSDVILSNTFGANRFALRGHRLEEQATKLAESGALISRRAADAARSAGRDVKVFASLGPTGVIVMMEEVRRETLSAAFAEAAEALEFGGADAIVLETFNELDELKIALEACKRATSLPVVACLTFSSGADKSLTMMGNSPEDLAKAARTLGADAVGANCGVGPDHYVPVARRLRAACDLPVWIKANAGLPEVVRGMTTFPMGPKEFADHGRELLKAGANFIGCCCGTTPAFIEALREIVPRA